MIARREPTGRDLGDACREAWGQTSLTDAPRLDPGTPPPLLLVTPTKFPSAVVPQRVTPVVFSGISDQTDAIDKLRDRRDARGKLHRVLRQESSLARVAACGSRVIPNHAGVSLWRRQHKASGGYLAHFSGVQRCGNVWACPICAPKIRQQRALDLDRAALRWMTDKGPGTIALLTLTLPHTHRHTLPQVLRVLRGALSALLAGRAWQNQKRGWGIAHYVRAYDFTYGEHGWHPHIHAVLFLEAPLDGSQVKTLEAQLWRRWADAVERDGAWDRPTLAHGTNLQIARCREDVAHYVCQVIGEHDDDRAPWGVAQEIMRPDLKASRHDGQRTPWQILADLAALGDFGDWCRWRDYETATRGLKAIRWSNGLRAAVELDAEMDDAAAAALPDGPPDDFAAPELVAVIPVDLWRFIRRTPLDLAQLLTVCEMGGPLAAQKAIGQLQDRARWILQAKDGALARAGLDDLGYGPDDFNG